MLDASIATFLVSAEKGSFNKASKALFVSSTAVLKQINTLEKRTGLTLFERTKRGVSLTQAGRIYYEGAKAAQTCADDALEKALEIQNCIRTQIRVGTSPLYPCSMLQEEWRRIGSEDGGFILKTVPFMDDESGSAFYRLGKDLDIIVGPFEQSGEDGVIGIDSDICELLPFGVCRFQLAMPHSHRLAKRESVELHDLEGERLMIMRRGFSKSNDAIRDLISDSGMNVALEDIPNFYQGETLNSCFQEGCLLLTLDCWQSMHPMLINVPLDMEEDLGVPMGVAYPHDPDARLKRFLQLLS